MVHAEVMPREGRGYWGKGALGSSELSLERNSTIDAFVPKIADNVDAFQGGTQIWRVHEAGSSMLDARGAGWAHFRKPNKGANK